MDTLDDYLQRLASGDAVPGGGSASAVAAALGAALVAMVGRIRSSDALVSHADRLRGELHDARIRDEVAFAAVVAAQALPKGNDEERSARREALAAALLRASREPLHAASLALDVLRLTQRCIETDLGALSSDIGCAAEFAHASLAGCAYNVRINHRYMRDEPAIAEQEGTLAGYEAEAADILERVRGNAAKALAKP